MYIITDGENIFNGLKNDGIVWTTRFNQRIFFGFFIFIYKSENFANEDLNKMKELYKDDEIIHNCVVRKLLF